MNELFLKAVFGPDYQWAHCTDFGHPPDAIPAGEHLRAWKGDYYCRYNLSENTNQYFCISTFFCDDQGQARRRKALFRQTHCIVLDDVREKLSMDQVSKLPSPSWILETSKGSEQWGYILNTPCTNRQHVENLLDGLVANGLAPDGRDPGMKGVTRYVRLPDGINNKASKGHWQCRMLKWEPFNTWSMEQLAEPFLVNLEVPRREQRVDGASLVDDHPIHQIPDIIQIKEVRSPGRYDIRCPWTDYHTGQEDSGAAIFTNSDGSLGFKCHHGNCQDKTARDLLSHIESKSPGFRERYKIWQMSKDFDAPPPSPIVQDDISFIEPSQESLESVLKDIEKQLRAEPYTTQEARVIAERMLKHVDNLSAIDRKHWHDIVCDAMRWNKTDFKMILNDFRKTWYDEKVKNSEFYDTVFFVKEINQFYDYKTRMFLTTEGFQNAYSHEDAEARKTALQDGRVKKVDKLDYAPKMPLMFIEDGILYGNTWSDENQPKGVLGDATPWLEHFGKLGWNEHERKHVEQWMAFTLRYPEKKINHALLLGSGEGCGKDFLLYPLVKGMNDNCSPISGEELLSDFNEYLLGSKYIHINETDLADHKKATQISNKLKPMAAAPPDKISVNDKGVKRIKIRNICNVSMTTNSRVPLKLNQGSRRIYALWSDLNTRGLDGQLKDEWKSYWNWHWYWMKKEGWKYVLYHLYNNVDLSDFEPYTPPIVTEFLMDIQNSSKTSLEQTLDSLIENKIALFKSDLLTVQDMVNVLKSDNVFIKDHLFCDLRYATPSQIGKTIGMMPNVLRIRTTEFNRTTTIYAIRNNEKYATMPKQKIIMEYRVQMEAINGMMF